MSGQGNVTRRQFIQRSALALALGRAAGRRAIAQPNADRQTSAVPASYPDDAFSRPLVDRLLAFDTLDGCSPSGDVYTRNAQYARNAVQLTERGVEWTLEPRDVDSAALAIAERIRREPVSVAFTIANRSERPVQAAVVFSEMPWTAGRENQAVPWALGPNQEVGPGEERRLEFPFAAAEWGGRTEPAAPRWPSNGLLVVLQGLEPGAAYRLELRELTVNYPPAPGLRVLTLSVPRMLTAGTPTAFGVVLDGAVGGRGVDLEIRREPYVIWRVRLTPEELAALAGGPATVERTVPWYLPPGEASVGVVCDGYRVAGPETSVAVENRTTGSLPLAERRLHNGRPTMFVNGTPVAWQGYSSYDYQPGSVAEFGAHGVTGLCVPVAAGAHVHNGAKATWVSRDTFDFREIDERVCFSLAAAPDAFISLRVSLGMPPFWLAEHEGELTRTWCEPEPLIWAEGGSYPAPSLASEAWRAAQEQALRALLAYCRGQPWANRLVAVWLTCEVTEEWFAWGCNDDAYADYSAPNEQRFAQWLADRGWHDASAIPGRPVRDPPGYDLYPDTPEGRHAAAYHRYSSELAAECIGHFAKVVKEETDGRCLVGVFYGYVIQLAGEPRQALSGHFALREVLDDPAVDFLGGIPLHEFRTLIGGYNPYVSATDSIATAGKLYCNENDLFSWLHPLIWYTEYNPADPRGAAISMHRRECATDAVHGALAQKFSLMCTWHHDAALQADFAFQSGIHRAAIGFDRTPVEEVAFVVDDMTLAWTPPQSRILQATNKRLLYHLGTAGAPVGVWLLSDLDRLPERIRFVCVASATAARAEDIERLRRLIARGGRTVLVVGAPGLVDPATGRWHPAAPGDLLGLPIRVADASLPAAAVLADDGTMVSPIDHLVRPRAELNGEGFLRYSDGATAGAQRNLAGGRLIWCGSPPLHTGLLRSWLVAAGVHCYAPEGFFVHASRELVAVTSSTEGEAELLWPTAVRAEDLFDGWRAEGRKTLCQFGPGQTRLLRVVMDRRD